MRLGEAVRAEELPADHVGQQVAALGLGAEAVDREAGERVDADPQRHAGPARRELLDDLQVDLVGLAAAPDVLTEREAEQSGVAEHPEHLAGEALLPFVLRGLRRQLGVGQLSGQRDQVVRLGRGQFAVDRHGSPSSKTVLRTVPQYC